MDIAALPEEFHRFEAKEAFWNAAERRKQEQIAGIVVSVHSGWQTNVLRLVPQRVVLGIGCRRDKDPAELAAGGPGIGTVSDCTGEYLQNCID